ncbi:MAG TPA: RES family NAD+ phosphorylase, partial [Polyangiaceae bacterium]|nr:RES family NAD+ phosphorylase [Polyangiaceae bacterium]
MAKFPEPPYVAELARHPPAVRIVAAGTMLWRIYFRSTAHHTKWNTFRRFGPTGSRFDHHETPKRFQDRGIMYTASGGETCFAECFQSTRTIDVNRGRPALVAFALARDLELLDLTGDWPTQVGASMAINSGPRPRAQRWARAIYAAYPNLHGIWYASSMAANEPAQALFERATGSMPNSPTIHR